MTKPVAAGRLHRVGVVQLVAAAPREVALPVMVHLVEMVAVLVNRPAGLRR
ncbi:hypothetical protein AA0312_2877 [Acetobacter tropicalis NRIC 0312]|nr:hypothetical protein AA0312_2877 [Acetobacter tropicalis NRIC 0312]